MLPIDPKYLSTTMITVLKDGLEKGTATGFFYVNKNKNLFLVTNKHNIYGKEDYQNPIAKAIFDKFKLNLHIDEDNLVNNEYIEIPLFEREKEVWLEHQNPKVDVIILPVNINRNKYIIRPIDDSYFDNNYLIVDFEKIFIMGYPHGWYDKLNNIPITRIGHLSSPFYVGFKRQDRMLADVEVHPGMSGGPVFMLLNFYTDQLGNVRGGTEKHILVGICSGKPIIKDKKENIVQHRMTCIWSYRLIQEILKKNFC